MLQHLADGAPRGWVCRQHARDEVHHQRGPLRHSYALKSPSTMVTFKATRAGLPACCSSLRISIGRMQGDGRDVTADQPRRSAQQAADIAILKATNTRSVIANMAIEV